MTYPIPAGHCPRLRPFLTFAALTLLALTGTGCGGGDGFTDPVETSRAIQTTWVKTALTRSGGVVSCAYTTAENPNPAQEVSDLTENGVVLESCGFNETIQFLPNGTYQITVPPPRLVQRTVENGTYRISGNTITLIRTSSGYDINGDGNVTASTPDEITELATVTNPASIPPTPRQRVVLQAEIVGNELRLTPVPQPQTNALGTTIVTEGAVNAVVSNVTSVYIRR